MLRDAKKLWGSFSGYVPEFQLENVGLAEAEADPSTAEYQTLAAEAPLVNGEPSDPPVTGISPQVIPQFNCSFKVFK